MTGSGKERRLRMTVAVVSLAAALGSLTWWLLAGGTRGAEIANVIALPAALVGMITGVLAIRPGLDRVWMGSLF